MGIRQLFPKGLPFGLKVLFGIGDDGHSWECVCGETEDGFDTFDQADAAAIEHRRTCES